MARLRVIPLCKMGLVTIGFSIFLIGCFASARHSKPLRSDPDGFGGIKWGTEISALNDMEKSQEDQSSNPDVVWYTRKRNTFVMGQAKLKDIFYSFWMGKFDSAWIDFEGQENFQALKEELFKRFGEVLGAEKPMEETQKTDRGDGFYAWWGKNTEVLLSYSNDRHKGTLTINSTKIREEKRAYEKQKEKEEWLKARGF